ncbi:MULTISPECIES: aldehyde dehydrogenase family protein [unclassified Sinorhizobium]|uniref:aldehyde dehydrogenase family protein n=1 Tax=unclassified Sinorhizobium TaxID=2613772 RepID=UPI0024C22D05|nr:MULTISPECIES: aldehyde dehydrogenase family protein [unclassified Sinorhizobium]MDK1373620.1 aldehyde dehydrogenase family protein [Sinorhizobium sp. 6-70]MDK1477821.1 aldehyde dehydrogenase family protein [Sinorhizobium sp. 6-117]
MRDIDTIYINGAFVTPHGQERALLFNPSTEEQIGTVRLGDEQDVDVAVAAAKRAFPAFSRTTKAERIAMLERLAAAVTARAGDLTAAMAEEYGAPVIFTDFSVPHAASVFLAMAKTLDEYEFRRTIGRAEVEMKPAGVAVAITPWNSNIGFIASKLATAIAAGTTIVIKPSEMSAIQTQVLTECLHAAGLPVGVFSIVNGTGAVVGAALSANPDIAKISFTGSTTTGRAILAAAAQRLARVTLELGGKSPSIILDDADLDTVIPQALTTGFMNSGQACVAGTRLLVPATRMEGVAERIKAAVVGLKVGAPTDPEAMIGPMVSRKQWDRVQSYIRLGQEEGATLLAGGEGRPEGLAQGWFVRPTVFSGVSNRMRIAREEIFGPVLCLIPYRDEAEAIAIANDTDYGLSSYVFGADTKRARRIAEQLEAGRVVINGAPHEPLAPFGGFKQSGIGREFGVFGLESFLEPRAVLI